MRRQQSTSYQWAVLAAFSVAMSCSVGFAEETSDSVRADSTGQADTIGETAMRDSSESGANDGNVNVPQPVTETHFGADADMSNVPDCVPRYPDATDTQSTMHSSSSIEVSGLFQFKTNDTARQVVDHYKQAFASGGLSSTSESITNAGDKIFGAINGELGDGCSINVMIIEDGGESKVAINYDQKKL